jgi:hypothetical protein
MTRKFSVCQLVRLSDRPFWTRRNILASQPQLERARTRMGEHALPSTTTAIWSPSVPRTTSPQSLGATFTLQHSSQLSVTFKGRKVSVPSPRAEYNRLKIEQRVISVFFSSRASLTGIQLQTQSTRLTSSLGLQRVPIVPHRARTGPECSVKKGSNPI